MGSEMCRMDSEIECAHFCAEHLAPVRHGVRLGDHAVVAQAGHDVGLRVVLPHGAPHTQAGALGGHCEETWG